MSLQLSHNELCCDINAGHLPKSLFFLDISYNHFRTVSLEGYKGILTSLIAHDNDIMDVSMDKSSSRAYLQTLDVSNNPLSGRLNVNGLVSLIIANTSLYVPTSQKNVVTFDVRSCPMMTSLPDCDGSFSVADAMPEVKYFYSSDNPDLVACPDQADSLNIELYEPRNFFYKIFRGTHIGIPEYLVYSGLAFPDDESTYLCPTIMTHAGIPALMDASFYNYTACACRHGYYGIPPNCQSCPVGALCDESGVALPGPARDYYGVYTLVNIWPQGWVYDIEFLECPTTEYGETACLGAQGLGASAWVDDLNQCKSGYGGHLCARCLDGYYSDGAECVECDGDMMGYTAIASIIFGSVGLYLICGWINGGTEIFISMFFLQMFAQLFMMRIPQMKGSYVGAYITFASLDTSALACFGWEFDDQFYAVVSVPYVLMIAMILSWIWSKCKGNSGEWLASYCKTCVDYLYLTWFPLIVSLWRVLDCTDGYLTQSPWHKCPVESDMELLVIALVTLVVFGIGLPVLMFVSSLYNHSETSLFTVMFDEYEPSKWYFGWVAFARNVVITFAFGLLDYSSIYFIPMVFGVLNLHGIIVVVLRPYADNDHNVMEATLNFVSCLLYITVSSFFIPGLTNVDTMAMIVKGIGYITVICSVIFVLMKYSKQGKQSHPRSESLKESLLN